MAYLDSGQDASPSFLQALARSLGLGAQSALPPNRAALASALAGQPLPPPGTHYAQLPGPPLLLSNGGDAAATANVPLAATAARSLPAGAGAPLTAMRGSLADVLPYSGSVQAPSVIAATPTAPNNAIVVPGYEAKGPLTRAQVVAASDDDKTMPAEENWDAAAAKLAKPSATQAAPQPSAQSLYEQTLKARFDQQEQIARTATNPEIAKMAIAEANKINDELSASRKPGSRILSDAELTAAERATGAEYQLSPEGVRSQVAGTAADTTRAPNEEESARLVAAGFDPKRYQVKDGQMIPIAAGTAAEKKELRVIGKDTFTGLEQYGIFDPSTGQVTPYTPPGPAAKEAAAAIPAQIQELGLPSADAGQGDKTPSIPLPPDQLARLEQVDPHIRATVESILQGRLGLPKITAGRGNPLPLAITQAVLTVNPNFDANTNQSQLDLRKRFNTGGSNNTAGQLILNSNSALDHFVPLVEASDELPNYGALLGAGVLGTERNVPGNLAGEDFKKKVAALQSAATPASAETMKYLAGTTGGGEEERQQLIKSWADIGGSPGSRRQAIVNYLDDMLAKKAELQNEWHHGMDTPGGPIAPDFPVISDTARNSVIKMGYGDLLRKYGLDRPSGIPQGVPTRAPATSAPIVPISGRTVPPPGFTKGGYRFKGGDPSQKGNWEPAQ